MIKEISKNGEAVFAELTKNTIVLCNAFGFKFMETLFKPFENTQEGHSEYLYNVKETDVVTIENVSEKEFLVVSKNQTIRIMLVNSLEDKNYLETFNYKTKDVWFSYHKFPEAYRNILVQDVYALTEFTGFQYFKPWKKFLKNYFMGRFGGIEHIEQTF
jgi:hypothetical protein